ncbi:MAG: DNA repair protein RecO, partial [Actinomycetota bacterium]|nr:DNA repair protein RecO [Actinomycetota bacterium]
DWDTVGGAEDRTSRQASGLVAAYLSWHLDRNLRSLEYVES